MRHTYKCCLFTGIISFIETKPIRRPVTRGSLPESKFRAAPALARTPVIACGKESVTCGRSSSRMSGPSHRARHWMTSSKKFACGGELASIESSRKERVERRQPRMRSIWEEDPRKTDSCGKFSRCKDVGLSVHKHFSKISAQIPEWASRKAWAARSDTEPTTIVSLKSKLSHCDGDSWQWDRMRFRNCQRVISPPIPLRINPEREPSKASIVKVRVWQRVPGTEPGRMRMLSRSTLFMFSSGHVPLCAMNEWNWACSASPWLPMPHRCWTSNEAVSTGGSRKTDARCQQLRIPRRVDRRNTEGRTEPVVVCERHQGETVQVSIAKAFCRHVNELWRKVWYWRSAMRIGKRECGLRKIQQL